MDIVSALKGIKPKVAAITVPELEEQIYVRVMSGAERYAFEQTALDEDSNNNGLVEVTFLCLCDENGKRVFTDESDKATIEQLPADVLYLIFNKALEINRINTPDVSDEVKR